MLKIDMHSHILPAKLPNFSKKFGYGDFISLHHHKQGFAKMMKGNQFFREIAENCWDPQVRIEEYKEFHTQVQVVCTIPVMFSYWAKPEDCLELSRFLNDHIAEVVNLHPKNYIGLGTVPMQDADLAIKELERIKYELKFPGIQIGSNINDKNLNEAEFYPIFEACEKLGLAVLVHPWNMMGQSQMNKYWLPWLVGMPAETSRAICSMIFGGVFEKLPNLRTCFAHAGGSFFATIGRIEHGFMCRPDLVAIDNNHNPREYLNKFWIDCITHDPLMLEYVLRLMDSKKVCLGSDYPFPLGDLEIGAFVEKMNLAPQALDDIMHQATLDWLQLEKKDFL
ncbi:amidohydrolase family protein [Cytophagales bacterium LB-30]|uniref:2-amino-3-carboxymuconate-6-semialdehyde decarboxylase n=1 Tax=Shiella aurantiaca TaxID=3058365 RepID=A0ABT8F0S3_9BACT|nr:amidohydrolase family protein [Shiella aurantiaca]MDN4164047.1 amidohydrolase family protein [Shiella aurantiaca]